MRRFHSALGLAGMSFLLAVSTVRGEGALAVARLEIQGSSLTIPDSDAIQTINIGEPARVRTCYGTTGAACGDVPAGDPRVAGLQVVAELRGPELPEAIEVTTMPGGTFLLPSFQREGDYTLDNIRLVDTRSGRVLGPSEPPRATLHVLQIVVTSATVTALSLADLQARGIHLSQESYRAFNFAVAFAFAGGTVTIDLPVLFSGVGAATPLEPPEVHLDDLPNAAVPYAERWQPPNIVPFAIVPDDRELLEEEDVLGGTLEFPLFGAIVIPGTVSFLNQFFDARLIVANAAPAGSGATLDNLTAALRLPAGNVLRVAATEPPVFAGQRIPLIGNSGERTVPPSQQASAAWTVEGLKIGNHALQFDIAGDLLRPGHASLPMVSRAQAAVEVVDARFNLTFSHPDVVRDDEAYTLYVTVTNLSRATQNDITVALVAAEIVGAHKAIPTDTFERPIETLAPGQARTLEFELVSDTTGKCFATTFQSDSPALEGTISLRTGVGTLGIPLSPATLVLPRFSERLAPPFVATSELLRANVRLLGLAHSLATAPAGLAPAGLPVLTTRDVEQRTVDLAEAGRRTFLHDGLLESLEVLALDQLGNRHPLEEFDELRRRITEEANPATDLIAGAALAAVFRHEQESRGLDAIDFFDHLAATTSYTAPYLAALLLPSGASPAPVLEIRQITGTETRYLAYGSDDARALRGIPFGEMFELSEYASGGAQTPLAVIGHAEADDLFHIYLHNQGGEVCEGRLLLIVPRGSDGGFRRLDLGAVSVPPHSVVGVITGAGVPDPDEGGFRLFWPASGLPVADAPAPIKQTVELPPFRIIGAVQDFRLGESRSDGLGNVNRPNVYGNGIAYLFNRPPATDIIDHPSVFAVRSTFAGLDVLGVPTQHVATKEGQAAFLQGDQRVLLVRYSGPISALIAGGGDPAVRHEQLLDPLAVADRFGNPVAASPPPIDLETAPLHVGGLVAGRVLRGTGSAAAGASVELLRVRHVLGIGLESVVDVVERTTADSAGSYYFDFIETPHWDTSIEDQFILRATVAQGADPITEPAGVAEVTSVIRQQGRVVHINIAMLGRGTVAGRLVYAGTGAPVAGGTVTAASTLFVEMKSATVEADGGFTLAGVPVGPITLTGRDGDGNAVYATVGVERPGDTVTLVLELQRSSGPTGEGTVLGAVVRRRGSTPPVDELAAGAEVAIYAGGNPIAHQQTDRYGRFRFDNVPAGQVSLQAADWRVSRTPALADLMLAAGGSAVVTLILPESSPHAVVGGVFLHNPQTNTLEPVANAVVLIPGPGVYARTAADGSYRIDGVPIQGVSDERYVVRAIDNDRGWQGETTLLALLDGSAEEVTAAPIVLQEPYGAVDGVVLDPLGRPLAGAQVILFPYGTCSSRGDGRFNFERVPLGFIERVIAHVGDGLQPGHVGYLGKTSTNVILGGYRAFATVRMRGSGVVHLRTLVGASVISSPIFYRPTVYHDGAKDIRVLPDYIQAETAEDGTLTLELPVGPFEIVAYNPFHGTKTITEQIEFPGQVRAYDIAFEDAGTVTGTVLDVDGIAPAPNVEVRLESEHFLPRTQRSDALGRFSFALVSPGGVRVTAAGVVGGVERVGASLGAITAGGQTLDLPIRLKAQGSVSGQVVEQQGVSLVPVPYAQVYAYENGYPGRRVPGEGSFVYADAQGHYQIQHLYAGGITVIARDPAQVARSGSAQGAITADWQLAEMPDVVLSTSVGSLAVTVQDPDSGAPVPDCPVTLDGQEATVSDAAGVARFEALPLGNHSVYAFHAPTGRSGRSGNLQLVTPGQHLEATLRLDKHGEVHGTLYDDEARQAPVAGATVELRGDTSVGELRALATTSGTNATRGRFEFGGIPEGRFTLEAAVASSPRRARTAVELTETSPIADVALVLEVAGDVYVRVFEALKNGPAEVDATQIALSVRLTQEDRYDFTQIEPVDGVNGRSFMFPDALLYRGADITAQELGGEQRRGRLMLSSLQSADPEGGSGSAGHPYQLTLTPKGIARVTVRDAQGRPVAGTSVSLWSTAGGAGSSATDANGLAIFTAVPAGALTASASLPFTSVGGVDRGTLAYDDDVIDLHITFAETVAAHGVVYQPVPDDAPAGTPGPLGPQAGAAVEITDAAGGRQTIVTGAEGAYRFVGLAVGGCTVRAWQPGTDALAVMSANVAGPDGNENALPALVLDASPPRIVSITPPPGMEAVSRTVTVEIVFSEPLHGDVLPRTGAGAPIFELRSAGGQAPPGSWTAGVDPTSGRQIVRFTPDKPYDNFSVYGLLIAAGPSGVRDRVGRLLADFGSVGSNFKTADTVGPEVIGTDPTLARPVPADAALRVDFNEVITAADEALDGDGIDDAVELYWGREIGGGGSEWQPLPVDPGRVGNGYSLIAAPRGSLVLTGDTLRRRLHVARVQDAFGNEMDGRDLTFRVRDHVAPAIDVPLPAVAPDGRLTPGLQYQLVPDIDSDSIRGAGEPLPTGDVDRVEYFLADPTASPEAPPVFVARAYPFTWSFVPTYTGNGVDPQQLPVWVRAVDTSDNLGNIVPVGLVIVKNEAPVIGSVSTTAAAPVAGTFYAGSTVRAAVNGLTDPDGAQVTLSAELWQEGATSALQLRPGVLVQRPVSGYWSDLAAPAFDFTLPLSLPEGSRLFARARAFDMHGANVAADSALFAIADDDLPPGIDGLVARRSWPAPAGATPPVFSIADRLYLELAARDGETAVEAITVTVDRTDIFPSPIAATRVAGSATLYRTGELTVPHDVFTGETTVVAIATATDLGGNSSQSSLEIRVAPAADTNAPTVEWLTPWEGAPWPASYVSTVSPGAGVALLLRVSVHDTVGDGAGGALPGSIAAVELRGPVRDDQGAVVLGPTVPGTIVAGSEVPGGAVYECLWRVPDGIPAGTAVPFEVRATDTGNTATTVPVRIVARPARRVWEGAHAAVPPGDPMVAAGGDPAGPVFLLDGATVSVFPEAGGVPRRVSSLLIYAGGADGASITMHPSVLTAPEVTSYASTALFYPLELQVDDVLAIGAGCSIDVSGRGLLGNTTTNTVALPGETAAEPFAGGSHGGLGWFGSAPGGWTRDDLPDGYLARPGSAYDSVRDPHLPGSGGTSGAASAPGGRGGGVARLLAEGAIVKLAGDLRADGGSGTWSGGGAGGSVLVRALRLEGRGRVTANGGNGTEPEHTGGGGGGRIAVRFRELGADVDLSVQLQTAGGDTDAESGQRLGGAGTAYVEAVDPANGTANGVGRLIIANRSGRPAGVTPLPALGDGTLAEVDIAAQAVTIDAPDALGNLTGDSLVVTAGDGSELGVFPILAQEGISQVPGSALRLRLAVGASGEQLAGLQAALGASTVSVHGRSRFAAVECRNAARIAADDDLAVAPVGAADPPVNDRASLTLDGEARALLRGEAPQLAFIATPAPGSDVRVGSAIDLEWTVTDPLGVSSVAGSWSLAGTPSRWVLAEPLTVDSGASPLSFAVGGAPPGPARYSVAATDLAGRSVTGSASWNVLPNEPPTATIAFADGTPAAVLPGQTVTVNVDAVDIEGLQQITLRATGPVLTPIQSQLVSGSSAHAIFSVAIAETAQPTDLVAIQAEVLDRFAPAPTPTFALSLGILPDTEPPAVAIALAPASAGDAYTAGDAVTVTATATDNVAARPISLTIDGQTFTSSSSPLVHAWTAPAVAATTPFVLQAQASDPAGHQTTISRTLTVQPLVNPGAPAIHFICPSTGAYLPAGYDSLVLAATAIDDIGVASIEFFREGDPSPFAIVTPSSGTPPTFTASATAPPLPAIGGQDVQLRARARDASNNFTDTTVTIHVVDAVTLDPSGNNDWPALATQVCVLRAGTLTLDQPRTLAGLIVLRGASITHSPSTPGAEKSVNLSVTGPLYLECGASIDVTARGYAPSQTYPGAVPPGHESGGSHLGRGGLASDPVASTYGSIHYPQESGGGGENGAWGHRGGGVARLTVDGDLICDGSIAASGAGTSGRGGAGGSIWITAESLSGEGTVTANGSPGSEGSGGGGAIALEFRATSGSILTTVRASGGATGIRGGAGTVLLAGPGSTFGDLVIDNSGTNGQVTSLPALGGGVAQPGSGGATLETDLGATIPAYFAGHWIEIADTAGSLRGVWQVESVSDRSMTLKSMAGENLDINPGDRWLGVYRFDSITVAGNAKLASLDPLRVPVLSVSGTATVDGTGFASTLEVSGSVEVRGMVVAGTIRARSMVLRAGTVLKHATTTRAASPERLAIEVGDDLVIEEGAAIDVSGRGYAGSMTYPGAVAPGHESGGSHLGRGGLATAPVASTFGSVSRPQETGGGGENEAWGQRGGGIVRLFAGGRLDCNGSILANGAGGSRAGAGGSVWITAGSVLGDGAIEARGGDTNWHGSGGGGAIAVEFESASGSLLAALRAPGGATGPKGGAGTIYLRGPGSTHGDLVVDNSGIDGQVTDLPALGGGVAQAGSSGAILVTVQAAEIPRYFARHWVEVRDVGETLKGTWRIAAIDGRTVTLESNTGESINVLPGDHWQGVYRFDTVTVKGEAKLDSQDGARVGAVNVEAGSELLWFDDTPPVIDPAKVTIKAHDGAFWVVGAAGAALDPGGIGMALLRNRRTNEVAAVTIARSGNFDPVSIAGAGTDQVELEATSAHTHPVTSKAIVGNLPANTGAPVIDTPSTALTRDENGHWHVVGVSGAVRDAEPPISLSVQSGPSGAVASGTVGADGSFDLVIACVSGDSVTLTATDGHPQPQSASLGLGIVPGNAAPIVDTSAITITYAAPVDHGEWREEAAYVLHFSVGAIADDEGPLDLEVRHGADEPWARTVETGEAFDWRLEWGSMTTGDRLELIVTDRDPTEPMSTTVQLGPLPPDNYGPPTIDQQQIALLPLGFGFQIAGRAGAIVDPDGPVTVTLSNPTRSWTSQPVAVGPDGAFYARLQGVEGDEILIQAGDAHPDLPLTGDSVTLGTLPGCGVVVSPIALGGHTVTKLRRWQVALDGGTLVAQPLLRWSPGDSNDETVGTPLGGLTHAADWPGDSRTGSSLVLDGTDLVPWVCADGGECPIETPGRLQVISSGALVRGVTHAGYLFLASEGDAAALHVVAPPLVDGTTGAISAACEGAVASLALPVPSGAHVLEVFPAFPGQMAVLTDLSGSELLLIDVTTPTAPVFVGAVDLEGSATPSWGVWNGGELLLGRSDGSVEIWRWGDSAPVLFARWHPAGAAARAAARIGDQLWVGLADGRLQQVDLLDPASPQFVGEMRLGAPVVGISDFEWSLLVATETGLFHVWPRVMPPEINPDSVAWGHEGGWSWARVYASSLEGLDSTSVRWGDAAGAYNTDGYIYEIFDGVATPPTIRSIDVLGVPSGDYAPSAWQPWGLWAATGDIDWFPRWNPIAPGDCSSFHGTFGNTNHDIASWGGVPWVATAAAEATSVELVSYPDGSAWWRDPPARRTLATTGVVAGVIGFDTTLLVLDDGLGVWNVGDPASPALASHADLLGSDPVSAARLVEQDWTLVLFAAGGNPGRVVPIDVADPANPVAGAELVLPGMLGTVIDLQRGPDGTLFLLTADSGVARLFRYDVGDPAAPALLAQIELPPGPPPIAMDIGYSGGETLRPTFVAVVREGWGVEAYAAGTLALLHSLPLPGVSRDVRFVPETSSNPARIIVAAGFGHGLISIEGLPGQPHISEVNSIGDVRRFAQRGEWHDPSWTLPSLAFAEVLTPGGFVVQPLPQRGIPPSSGSN